MRLRYAAYTSPGNGKRRNEDAVMGEPAAGVFALADGVGSTPGAAYAARAALAGVRSALVGHPEPIGGETFYQGRILLAFERAHNRVRKVCAEELRVPGATTLLVAWIRQRELRVGHVGDGAAWLWRDGVLDRLVAADIPDLATARLFDRSFRVERGVLQALGVHEEAPVPRLVETEWRAGDWLVLATDGVLEALTDAAIANRLSELTAGHEPHLAPERLVQAAIAAGAQDDCTAMVIWRA